MTNDSKAAPRTNRRLSTMIAGLTVFAVAMFQHEAAAQSVDGAVRLGLEGPLFRYDTSTLSSSEGAANDVTVSQTSLGPASGGAGIALGYGVGDVVIGGRLLFGTTKTKIGSLGESDATTFTLLPSIEYLVSQGDVRPFVAGALGYQSTRASSGLSESTLLVGPSFGLHGFVTPTLSIDTSFSALLSSGSARVEGAEFDRSGFGAVVTVGLSGWLGADPVPASSGASSADSPPGGAPMDGEARHPSSTASATAPNAGVVVEQRDQVSLSLDIGRADGGSLHLVLTGEPERNGATAQVTLSFAMQGRPSENCAARFDVGDTSFVLADVQSASRAGFESSTVALQGRTSITTLDALAQNRGTVAVSTCGQRWFLSPFARADMADFVRAFRKRAPVDAWNRFELPDCGVTVDVPTAAAKRADDTQIISGGKLWTASFDLPEKRGALAVSCTSVLPAEKPARVVLDGARAGMIKAVGGKLVKESDIPGGREVRYDVSGAPVLTRVLLLHQRLITVFAAPVNAIGADVVSRFMNSVQVSER